MGQYKKTESDLAGLKQVWAIILEKGVIKLPDSEWNQYSLGYTYRYHYDERTRALMYAEEARLRALRSDVKTIGVDWEKTDLPDYVSKSEFVGTDSPSKDVDILEGDLVLSNGQKLPLYMILNNDEYGVKAKVKTLRRDRDLNKIPSPESLVEKYFGN